MWGAIGFGATWCLWGVGVSAEAALRDARQAVAEFSEATGRPVRLHTVRISELRARRFRAGSIDVDPPFPGD